ncbi:MAG: rhomboid family intramembrane serine protease [Desulfovibrio sp.]|jgi:membrane associated rhomboid family serine protease|nr:rhomboid family intramembrane serine protease [Desulfovibrio sp.]
MRILPPRRRNKPGESGAPGQDAARASDTRERKWRPLTVEPAAAGPVAAETLDARMLVLAAKNIRHVLSPATRELYVPAEDEARALEEIRAFEREVERRIPLLPPPPARDNVLGVICFFLLLVVWHGLRFHWFAVSLPDPPFPADARLWPELFGLDKARVRGGGAWGLCVSALTLHADARHLFGNVGFGLLFFIPLCRRAGLGAGTAAAMVGGALGNASAALIYGRLGPVFPGAGLSLGFSTALFSALGVLCVLSAGDMIRVRSFAAAHETGGAPAAGAVLRTGALPLAAGLALLGFLGGGGEVRTDYAAHIFGFACGLGVGLPLLLVDARLRAASEKTRGRVDTGLCAAALLCVVGAWCSAVYGL